ncbi:hypothetical protein [Vibrio sp. 1CM23M]|uniref:hypothetical protein n=1 Tax=Vibrio sp. 1CM23M TaxID=2929164 RepID=UPI0020BD75B3|nr:hypothetical protein [Vibrio sp. 1CM23M]MCK8072439.1 hypothetical protein [Vibrio sp. 1CM23M]
MIGEKYEMNLHYVWNMKSILGKYYSIEGLEFVTPYLNVEGLVFDTAKGCSVIKSPFLLDDVQCITYSPVSISSFEDTGLFMALSFLADVDGYYTTALQAIQRAYDCEKYGTKQDTVVQVDPSMMSFEANNGIDLSDFELLPDDDSTSEYIDVEFKEKEIDTISLDFNSRYFAIRFGHEDQYFVIDEAGDIVFKASGSLFELCFEEVSWYKV